MTDEEFFNRVEKIRKKMFAIAFPYFRSESMAIDMVDEAIYKGFLKKRSLRKEEFFETWMIRILMNTCATQYKRSSRHQSFEEFELDHHAGSTLDSEKMELMDAVSHLSNDLQRVVSLKYFGGYTTVEIAGMLKIPQGTVSSRLRRALEQLREEMGDEKV